jgi:tripartite-type tricarboxylate transporter receptor subunit TctC
MNKRMLLKAAALCLASTHSFGQGTGEQPIRIIIPLSPGTPSDSVTRIVATAMSEQLKRTIIIDNKPGANGVLAAQELLRSKPDGNTLMLGGISPVALNVAVIKNLPYDPRRDFTPIGGIYNAFQAYIVSNTMPAKSFSEFVAFAKKNPGKVSVGHYSALTKIQFAALEKSAGISFLQIPYKTTNTAYTDVMGGAIDASICDVATAMTLAKSGKLKALAITLPERSPLAPGLATASETVPGLAFPAWSGLIGPAGMPKDIVVKLNATLNTVLRQKETISKMAEGAAQPWPTSPEELASHIDKEISRWTKLAQDSGIQPE